MARNARRLTLHSPAPARVSRSAVMGIDIDQFFYRRAEIRQFSTPQAKLKFGLKRVTGYYTAITQGKEGTEMDKHHQSIAERLRRLKQQSFTGSMRQTCPLRPGRALTARLCQGAL